MALPKAAAENKKFKGRFPSDVLNAARHVRRLARARKLHPSGFFFDVEKVAKLFLARKSGMKQAQKCCAFAGMNNSTFSLRMRESRDLYDTLEPHEIDGSPHAQFIMYWENFFSGTQVQMIDSMRQCAMESPRVSDKKMFLEVTDRAEFGQTPQVQIDNSKTTNILNYNELSPQELISRITELEKSLPAPLQEIANWVKEEDVEDAEYEDDAGTEEEDRGTLPVEGAVQATSTAAED